MSRMHVNRNVKHVEECWVNLAEEDLQKILFKSLGVKTGNYGKMKIIGASFPMRVQWDELLEHDSRQKLIS